MDYYHGGLWPDVTSPIARRVLMEAFSRSPIDAEDHFYDLYKLTAGTAVVNEPVDPALETYRRELRSRLQDSNIVVRLFDQWWIDAAYMSLPVHERYLVKLFRPKTVEGSVRHFERYLDWYLGLQPADGPDQRRNYMLLISTISLSVLVLVAVYWLFGSIGIMGLMAVVPMLLMSLVVETFNHARFHQTPADRLPIARAEFYLYLRNALRDTETDSEL